MKKNVKNNDSSKSIHAYCVTGMPNECPRPKNPCKICLGSVTLKTGLQCQGACKTWVHYECLNYTPGKVRDIKKGIIKVTCPCPDCKTIHPKEFRTDSQFSCTNLLCPANRPPKCENYECPINKMIGTSFYGPCDKKACAAHGPGTPGYETVQFPSSSRTLSGGGPCASPPMGLPQPSSCPPDRCEPPPCLAGCAPVGQELLKKISQAAAGGCQAPMGGYQNPASNCPSGGDVRQPTNSTVDVMQQMCNTVTKLAEQINGLMCKMQEIANTRQPQQRQLPPKRPPCPPPPRRQPVCDSQGPRSFCPKPCYCPNNPKNC